MANEEGCSWCFSCWWWWCPRSPRCRCRWWWWPPWLLFSLWLLLMMSKPQFYTSKMWEKELKVFNWCTSKPCCPIFSVVPTYTYLTKIVRWRLWNISEFDINYKSPRTYLIWIFALKLIFLFFNKHLNFRAKIDLLFWCVKYNQKYFAPSALRASVAPL